MALIISDNFNRVIASDLGTDWVEIAQEGAGFEIAYPPAAADNALAIGASTWTGTGKHVGSIIHATALDSTAVAMKFKAKWAGPSADAKLHPHFRHSSTEYGLPFYSIRIASPQEYMHVVRGDVSSMAIRVGDWGAPPTLDSVYHDYEVRVWTETDRVVFQLLIDATDYGCVYDTHADRIVTGQYVGFWGSVRRGYPIYVDDFEATTLQIHHPSAGIGFAPRLPTCQTRIFDDFNRASIGGLWHVEKDAGATLAIVDNELEADAAITYASAVCVTEPCPADTDIQLDVDHGSANVTAIEDGTRFELRFRMPGTAYDEGPFYALMLEKSGGGDSGSNAGMSLWRYTSNGLLTSATKLWSTDAECLTTSVQVLRVRVFDQPGAFGADDQVLIEVYMDGDYVGEYVDDSTNQVAATAGNFVGLFFAIEDNLGAPPWPDNCIHVDDFLVNRAFLPHGDQTLRAGCRFEPRLASVTINAGVLRAGATVDVVPLVEGTNCHVFGPHVDASWAGRFRVVDRLRVSWAGRGRVLDPALEEILVWHGPDECPDISGPPSVGGLWNLAGTIYTANLPNPMPTEPTPWYFVFVRVNKIGLRSAPRYYGPVMLCADGIAGDQPSPLNNVAMVQTDSGVYIEAEYRPLADGDHAATEAAFWITESPVGVPIDPVTTGEPDFTPALTHVDGLAQVRQLIPAELWESGSTIKVIGLARYDSPTIPGTWVESEPSNVVQLTTEAQAAIDLTDAALSLRGQFGQGTQQ